MKKLIFGLLAGTAAGLVGYKIYKENREEILDFIDEKILEKIEDKFKANDTEYTRLEDLDIDELKEIKEEVSLIIDEKEALIRDLREINKKRSIKQESIDSISDELDLDCADEYIYLNNK